MRWCELYPVLSGAVWVTLHPLKMLHIVPGTKYTIV